MLDGDIAKKVNSMSREEINKELVRIVNKKDFRHIWNEALNIVYSRSLCGLLNIDYTSINTDDFKKAEVYAYYKRVNE